jgi:hypothetical protein
MTAPQPRRKGGLAALIAVVAVLLSLVSLGVAAWSLHKANLAVATTRDLVGAPAATPAGNTPTQDPASTDQPTTEPVAADPTGTPQAINPEASFAPAYQNENLKAQVKSNNRAIDLDKPAVDGDPDITLIADTATVSMRLSPGVTASTAENGAASPKECLRQIQLSALDPDSNYPLRQGQAFCILTSLGAAQSVGETQKMVVLTIAGISDDRVVSINATAYVVPR